MKKILLIILIFKLLVTACANSTKEIEKSENLSKNNENYVSEEEILTNNIIEDRKEVVNTDQDMVNYVENIENDVTTLLNNNDVSKNNENKIKNTFILLTDFIFYGGEIKGKTFAELVDSAKTKILDIYERIDAKIEEKYPNYKEHLKESAKDAYSNVKQMVIDLKNKIKSEYKDYVGEEAYNETGEAYNEDLENLKDVYETYKPYVDKAKEKTKEYYEEGKQYLNDWYQKYKEGQ